MSANTVGLSQEYTRSKSEIGMLPWNQIFPQVGGWSIDVLLKLQTINKYLHGCQFKIHMDNSRIKLLSIIKA
jgi:hypothetical protein